MATGPYMDEFFAVAVQQEGAAVGNAGTLNCTGGLTATYNEATQTVDLSAPAATPPMSQQVIDALAATTSPVEINGENLTNVNAIELVNGTTIYSTAATSTNASPFVMLQFLLAANEVATVQLVMQGVDNRPAITKYQRSWCVWNNAGVLVITDASTIGSDVDGIGIAAPIAITLADPATCSIGASGRAATTISWACVATVQINSL